MDPVQQIVNAAAAQGVTVDPKMIAAALQSAPYEVVLRNALAQNASTSTFGGLLSSLGGGAGNPSAISPYLGEGGVESGLPQAKLTGAPSGGTVRLGGADSGDTIGSYPGMGQPAFASDPYVAKGTGSGSSGAGSILEQRLINELGLTPEQARNYIVSEGGIGGALELLAKNASGKLGGGGGGAAARTMFPEELDFLRAQTQSLGSNDQLARDKFAQDKIDNMNKFATDLRRLGLEEQAFKAEDAARNMTFQFQQQQEARLAQQAKVETIMGMGNLDLGYQQMNADYQAKLAQVGMERDKATREILSGPSDVLARLFFQRGGTSPAPIVSHADLINRLSTTMPDPVRPTNPLDKYKGLLDSILNAPAAPLLSMGGPAAAGGAAPLSPINPYATINAMAAAQNAAGVNTSGFNVGANATMGGAPLDGGGGAGYAKGGSTTDRVFLGNEEGAELIMNPEGAPLTIVDADTTKKVLKKNKGKLSPPGHALGTLGSPTANFYDQYKGTTQDQLLGLARESTAPGPSALLSGGLAPKLDIPGLPLVSAQQFGRLTGDERESLRPRLGVEFQTTLEDLTDMIKMRYGGTRTTAGARLGIR